MAKITIEDLVTAVRLVKKETCRDYATVADTARMLGARKMDVLLFLDENPRLVHAEERFRERRIRRKVAGHGALRGRSWWEETTARGASLGLCLIEAYATVEENPYNPEWLEAAKARYTRTLWLSDVDNYGQILGRCCLEDARPSSVPYGHLFTDNRRNTWLWRNTREKLEAAKALGGCVERDFCMGGFGDSYIRHEPYAVTLESRKVLENAGWTLIG